MSARAPQNDVLFGAEAERQNFCEIVAEDKLLRHKRYQPIQQFPLLPFTSVAPFSSRGVLRLAGLALLSVANHRDAHVVISRELVREKRPSLFASPQITGEFCHHALVWVSEPGTIGSEPHTKAWTDQNANDSFVAFRSQGSGSAFPPMKAVIRT